MTVHVSEKDLLKLVKELEVEDLQQESEPLFTHTPLSSADDLDQDGEVWIENNKIYISNPYGSGKMATIVPLPPLMMSVNGKKVENKTFVKVEDHIEWYVEQVPMFTIHISEDALQANLVIHANDRFGWKLQDKSPSNILQLEVHEDKNNLLETLAFESVIKRIEELGIKLVKFPEVYNAIQSCTMKPTAIAQGKPPTPSRDAYVELYFQENVENYFTEVAGTIDFRNHLNIPSARKGDIIGKKIPPVIGEAGYDIYGKVLLPENPKDFRLIGRDHVYIDGQGQVFAMKDGRPRITGTIVKFVDIATSYIVAGNVDLRTGNIVFSGDVIVYGDVTENMIVESLGNVYIMGSVYCATITATGNIVVKGNIVRSNLYSGHFGVIYNRLFQNTRQLSNDLRSLLESARLLIQAITEKNQTVNPGRVILILLERKYKDVYRTAREVLSIITNIHMIDRETMLDLKGKLEWFLQPIKVCTIESLDVFLNLQKHLESTHQGIASLKESTAKIDISQCYLSVLKANGDILIRHDGVLQCELYANGNIIFYEDKAVCRGSKIEAGGSISAMMVGDCTSTKTILKAGRKVIVKEIHDARVCIGRYCTEIFEPMKNQTFDLQSLKR